MSAKVSFNKAQLLQEFEAESEFNAKEHTWSFSRFIAMFVFWGFLGILLGGFINLTVVKFQGAINKAFAKWQTSAWFAFVQILELGLVSYAAIHILSRKFDDWIWSSFSGMIFWLTLIVSQTRLSTNISIIVADR